MVRRSFRVLRVVVAAAKPCVIVGCRRAVALAILSATVVAVFLEPVIEALSHRIIQRGVRPGTRTLAIAGPTGDPDLVNPSLRNFMRAPARVTLRDGKEVFHAKSSAIDDN